MTSQNQNEVREFLTTRRARVQPEQVELPGGRNRRVPGLRRGEVAVLADVSVEYYSKLERGHLAGVSESVLDAVARALLLDDAERDHLFDLARAANASPLRSARRSRRAQTIRPGLQFILDGITGGPAFIRNGRLDILAANTLGRALYADLYANQPHPINLARFAFLDRAHSDLFYPDWDLAADQSVAILRAEAGRDPYDKDLQDLIGELSTRSAEFRTKWGAHEVRRHATGTKHFHHPVVGDLDLVFEGADLPVDPGLSLLLYSAEPGSPTADALRLLASWAATPKAEAQDPALAKSTEASSSAERDS
jgi:transcriptional regulator with XRE-family HTH domain